MLSEVKVISTFDSLKEVESGLYLKEIETGPDQLQCLATT